jgi:hypothetical protein
MKIYISVFCLSLLPFLHSAQTRECKPPIWGLPDPFQIELQRPTLPLPSTPLRVALITAGSLRSFTFAEKSWRKYLFSSTLTDSSLLLHLFAHVIVLPECHISTDGLQFLKSLATDLEITHSTKLLIPIQDLIKDFPSSHFQETEFLSQFLTPQRGNYLDMYYRRHRAYQLSQRYAHKHALTWDLIMFLRPDTAFYAPVINLRMFHHTLLTWRQETQSTSSSNSSFTSPPRRPIYVPESCNFYGVCDRVAIGLPEEMDLYFQKNFFLEVMHWSVSLLPHTKNTSSLYCPLKSCFSMSEDLLECWFLMNSLTQVFYAKPIPFTFLTLRSLYAMDYCSSSREQYVTQLPTPYFAETDPDKEMARVSHSQDYANERESEGGDLMRSVEGRCGKRFVDLNLSAWCDERIMRCPCGNRNIWGPA